MNTFLKINLNRPYTIPNITTKVLTSIFKIAQLIDLGNN
jgi:hypothetical protein